VLFTAMTSSNFSTSVKGRVIRRIGELFIIAVLLPVICCCQRQNPMALLSTALATNPPSDVRLLRYWEISSKDPSHYWKLSHNRRHPQSLASVRLQPYGGKEKFDYLLQIAQFHLGTNFVPAEVENVYVGDGPTDHSQLFLISTKNSVVSYVILDYY
jgi:hypothetical protein